MDPLGSCRVKLMRELHQSFSRVRTQLQGLYRCCRGRVAAMNGANGVAREVVTAMNHQNGANGAGGWRVRGSRQSHDCVNPVRSCVENYFKETLEQRNKSKELINLSLGEF